MSMLVLHCCGAFLCFVGGSSLLWLAGFSLCGFSCCRARALGYVGFSSCDSQALEHRLYSCAAPILGDLRMYIGYTMSFISVAFTLKNTT